MFCIVYGNKFPDTWIPDYPFGNDNLFQNAKTPRTSFELRGVSFKIPGGDLLSHTATRAVSSAQRGLTSVFGMGTGVTPSA